MQGNRKHTFNLLIVGTEQIAARLINFATFAIVARHVDMAALGVLGLAWTFLSFVEALSANAIGGAIIRHPELKDSQRDTYFWICQISAVLGLLTMVLVSLSAQAISRPLFAEVSLFLGIIFLCRICFGAHRVIHIRNEKQVLLSSAGMVSALLASTVGILLALKGYGIWALLWRALLQALINGVICLRYHYWRPSWTFDRSFARHLIAFSAPLVGGQLGRMSTALAQQLLIGGLMGLNTLGLIEVARRLPEITNQMTMNVLSRLWGPLIARRHRDNLDIQRLCMKSALFATIALIGALGLIYPLSDEILGLIFGAQWETAGFLFATICAITGVSLIQRILLSYLITIGKPRYAWLELIYLAAALPGFAFLLLKGEMNPAFLSLLLFQIIGLLNLLCAAAKIAPADIASTSAK